MWFQITDPADRADVTAVVSAARRAAARCGRTVVVAIDGPSGSGKTSLAGGVVDELGCQAVHMDELYPGWDGLAAAVPLLTDEILEPLARGERAAYRVWDWTDGRWDGTRHVDPAPFLVVEGCGASVLPAGRYAALRVWVEAPPAERMRRGLARDGETYRPHWERWAAQEDALFAADRTRERADLVIDTTPAEAP